MESKLARIIHILRMTVVSANCAKHEPSNRHYNTELIKDPYQPLSKNMMTALQQFIDDVDLFTIKPDTRIFGCGNESHDSEGYWVGDFDVWASIPDDLDVPAPLVKRTFYGGLYAACASNPPSDEDYKVGRVSWTCFENSRSFNEWLDNSEDY